MSVIKTDIYDFPGWDTFPVTESVLIISPELKRWTKDVMITIGMSEEHAQIMAEVLVESDLLGVDTHGTYKIGLWVNRALSGGTNPKATFNVIRESPTTALVDAEDGFGQVMGYLGMNLAIEKANQYGTGFISVKQSSSLLALRYYALKAARAGKIGLVLTNADPVAAPWGGRTALLGTNPWCIAVPGEAYPLVMDTASTVTAWTKLVIYANSGEKIPDGWALDAQGNPTNDPVEAMHGTVLPVGAHKGFLFGLFGDILTGVLSGGAYLDQVLNYGHVEKPTRTSHLLAAIDVNAFMPEEEFKQRISDVIKRIKTSDKAPGVEEIRIPGERTYATYQQRSREGIPISPRRMQNILAISDKLNIEKPTIRN